MHKKTIALVITDNALCQICFEELLKSELTVLEENGFFSGANWTYTAKDILELYSKLPEGLKRECIEMYPHVARRIYNDMAYLQGLMSGNNPDLLLFLYGKFGEGSHKVLDKDTAEKEFAAKTGIARYYIFFLLAMNSHDTESSPRIIIDNMNSFKEFFRRVIGFSLFESLKYLHINGRIEIGRMITFRNFVEIFANPQITFRLAGESTLDNIRLVVDESGKVKEESLLI